MKLEGAILGAMFVRADWDKHRYSFGSQGPSGEWEWLPRVVMRPVLEPVLVRKLRAFDRTTAPPFTPGVTLRFERSAY
jgi:hypothetical protein